MNFDVHELLDVPKFKYKYDNEPIKKAWIKLLGNKKPKHDYQPEKLILVEVLQEFEDILLRKIMTVGTVYQMREERARHIVATQPKLIRIVGE